MTSGTLRQRLITYLTEADENKIRALYTLLEEDIENNDSGLTDEQYRILEEERQLHLQGKSPSYNRQESMAMIRTK